MEQAVIKVLHRHGYTVDTSTLKMLNESEWVTWAKAHDADDDYLIIGSDERFIVLQEAQQLKYWLMQN